MNQLKRLDVRAMLARGVEPFPEIRKRVDALKPDEGLTWLHHSSRLHWWKS